MSDLIAVITARDGAIRNRSADELCSRATTAALISECAALERFWRISGNLYERVRALFFLYTIHRYHLPYRPEMQGAALIPFEATSHLWRRRFEDVIVQLQRAEQSNGLNAALSSLMPLSIAD